MEIYKDLLAGTIGGLAGGLAMTVARQTGQELGLVKTPFPLKLERRIERKAGLAHKTDDTEEKGLAGLLHASISLPFGALYGLLQPRLRSATLLNGALFGAGVWAINIAGVGPALDLNRAPWDQPPYRAVRRFAVHVLYGVVTAVVTRQVRTRLD